jgi:hypothetical protein
VSDIDDDAPDPHGPPLAEALAASSARAADIVREHIEYYDEVLPTVLLGDVARWYWKELAQRSSEAPAARSAAAVLGEMYTGEPMETIIATGFLEGLPRPDEDGRDVVEELPGNLREELRRMEAWRPRSS